MSNPAFEIAHAHIVGPYRSGDKVVVMGLDTRRIATVLHRDDMGTYTLRDGHGHYFTASENYLASYMGR